MDGENALKLVHQDSLLGAGDTKLAYKKDQKKRGVARLNILWPEH